jgi:ABC-type transport system substrate-binding protein
MRLRRTAAGVVVGAAVLAGCGSSGARPVATAGLPATTTTSTTVPATTTPTTVPTTLPPTTTTTVVADATTADPQVLAQQLQAVLDRYQALYLTSRTDPSLPFTDQALLDGFLEVATHDFVGVDLLPMWSTFRGDATAVRNGPSGPGQFYLTDVEPVQPDRVAVRYCIFDDGVTYSLTTGEVLNDLTEVSTGTGEFIMTGGHWLVTKLQGTSEGVPAGTPNPCPGQSVLK